MAFDIEMIKAVYAKYPQRVAAARATTGKPLSLAEKILLILTDKSMRMRMRERSMEHAKKYDWDVIVKDLEKIYGDLNGK